MTETPKHKENFVSFINPSYRKVDEVNGFEIAKQFQTFQDLCFAQIPNEGTPADGNMYNSHMGAFVRSLDVDKDEFLKGSLAFYAKRNTWKAE